MVFQGKCELCGGTNFNEDSGHYYCSECNTQQQNRMDMEMNVMDMTFGDENIKVRGVKLKDTKAEKIQLTSWEEYNYILLGLVEEAMALGASSQLKKTVLQIWARYLRQTQAAFFSKTEAEMPKLPINYHKKDATIIYNKIHKRRRSASSRSTKSTTSKVKSIRRRRVLAIAKTKTKNALMKEQFEIFSTAQSQGSETTAMSSTGQSQSATSVKTNVPLEFTRRARRRLKKQMPKAHIIKHATDYENSLKCHKRRKQPNELEQTLEAVSQNILLAILYLGLNQIQSDIQVGDIIRFAREGHLSTFNVDHFFPDNILQNMERSSYVNFRGQSFLPTHRQMSRTTVKMCSLLEMRDLQQPDFVKLAGRYIDELCLPRECLKYLERFITFHPPEMNHWPFRLPNYEGRAIAFILFFLKWLLALDSHTEEVISRGAGEVNKVIQENNIQHPLLFNFAEWMKYIEMRCVILSEYHMPTHLARTTDEGSTNTQRYLEFLDHVKRPQYQGKKGIGSKVYAINQTLNTIYNDSRDESKKKSFIFKPSLTPSKSYLEDIIENHLEDVSLPNFLLTDHSDRTLDPYIRPCKFQNIMREHNIQLNIREAEGSKEWETVDKSSRLIPYQNPLVKINVVETEAKVDIKIPPKRPPINILKSIFRGRLANKRLERREHVEDDHISIPPSIPSNAMSIDILAEDSMDPGESIISAPRRNCEKLTMFDLMSDDEEEANLQSPIESHVDFFIPHFNYWHHFIPYNMCNMFDMREDIFDEVRSKLPSCFTWLLDQCSLITNIEPKFIYNELMIIEKEYTCVIDSVDNMTTRVLLREHLPKTRDPSSRFHGIW